MISATIEGANTLYRDLKAEFKSSNKNLELAMRIEGYRLMREMKNRLGEGAPRRGIRLKRLTFLARGLGIRTSRRLRKDRPLVRFVAFVRYHVEHNPFRVHIGFRHPKVPRYIQDWVALHERGFSTRISKRMRRYIISEGARRGKMDGGRTPFFLRKSTKTFRTPSRPIVGPFWFDQRDDAISNIRRNFRLKMAGKRI